MGGGGGGGGGGMFGTSGISAAAMGADAEPKVETTQMDFSKLSSQSQSSSSVVVQRELVEPLMTPDNRRLLVEESGSSVEWAPDEAKVELSGSAEQVKRAQRLLARVMMHSRWGVSAPKVRRLLKPLQVESVLCRLSPMNTLRAFKRTLTEAKPVFTIGKDKGNDLVIKDNLISRQHCLIELDSDRGAVYVLDCSTNGTFLNGIRLPGKQVGKVLLTHGDELLFKDPMSGEQEFGYIVNLTEMGVKEVTELKAPRRILTAEEVANVAY